MCTEHLQQDTQETVSPKTADDWGQVWEEGFCIILEIYNFES